MKLSFFAIVFLSLLSAISNADEVTGNAPLKIEVVEKKLAAGAQLLDVRTEEEWVDGHLKGAVLVDVTEEGFVEKAKAVLDPKKPVVVYCKAGRRSAMAAEQLKAAGYSVEQIEGGIDAWIQAGRKVLMLTKEQGSEKKAAAKQEEIEKLRNEIEQGRQSIGHIDAFVDMERAKLEENPDYEQAFMREALEEQEQIRKKIEENEKRMREIGQQ